MKTRTIALLFSVALSSGCYTTIIRSGKPASAATVSFDGRWHHGLVFGLAELSGPYDLSQICPEGWAEIKTETSFENFVARIFTETIYWPQTITVRCSSSAPANARGANVPPSAAGRAPETPSGANAPPAATPPAPPVPQPTAAPLSSPPPAPQPSAPP